ncbi:efflux RND transporter periplasmic adaptor subunit [Oceanobacillus alkalisoli]|uniref:efflux RND transporter periplasmic adaptor subunit n=1 Tax=Oceanobacillus alkalisoli TaxID=2925113 RepID=UPI001F11F2B1|nr:efflux RND transporter periplasmic adaptor subunit [Oceanobacillus alkalisoli]MCF3943949.1 efflux RND transporter periplasmic adaptor subunit [Oceanobacillus alkalisoli]
MRKNRFIQLGILVFIALNLLLVYLDDEARVDRVSYVNKWSESVTADLKKELYKPVVLEAADEEEIYFDRTEGVFQQFLVAVGEEVTPGSSLFTYRVENYYETESDLLQQMERVQGEMAAIEQAISQMEAYHIPADEFNPASSVLITEEDIFVELPESPVEAELMKEQFIAEKEQELAAKTTELTTVENQLSELRDTGDMITYESPFAGKIKQISTDLGNPLIVIESTDLHATGDLSEAERLEVETGMPAILQLEETDVLLEGSVDSLDDSPVELDVEKESIYPFTANFPEDTPEEDEEGEETETEKETGAEMESELLPGYHGTLTITLEESMNATTIFDGALLNGGVWQMTSAGKLEQKAVETGLYEDNQFEITSGLEVDTSLAEGPVRQLREGATYITPLKWRQVTKESFHMKENDWLQPFVSGLLSR